MPRINRKVLRGFLFWVKPKITLSERSESKGASGASRRERAERVEGLAWFDSLRSLTTGRRDAHKAQRLDDVRNNGGAPASTPAKDISTIYQAGQECTVSGDPLQVGWHDCPIFGWDKRCHGR
ncbi:MAG: hypothetical protein J5J00_17125 [Deltaproteobacteria bacterium]|nr:hypothetical protein [Deltaproteobacteria bacterium]